MIELWAEATFEASHTLSWTIGGVEKMHGHSYWFRVYVISSPTKIWPLPELQAKVRRVAQSLDHQHLNDLMREPTMESIAEHIHYQIPEATRIQVWRESVGCGVEWRL